MLSVKQIETFYWVAELGTVQRAADRLHITQSAATKRLQEVEAIAAEGLFERVDGKKSILSKKGREIYSLCEKLLESIESIQRLQRDEQPISQVLHVGMTELIALTWFPTFIREMRSNYPDVLVRPEIDQSEVLRGRVVEGRLDLALVAEPVLPPTIASVELGAARYEWLAPHGTFKGEGNVPLDRLATWPILEPPRGSIVTSVSGKLFERAGVEPNRIYAGTNDVVVGGLIESGIGIGCLPIDLFGKKIEENRLDIVTSGTTRFSLRIQILP
ncbi:LysR family transcriptional regulator [Cupriavidus basilensis OR16]|uniref:LysR family transcriptional regulator n=1 Tax=Cupriavidus basilensis OR16 TaxID=1127483 RepID=H1S1U4_9BURK|nr:LysR family transcriptional regulator [Cupriavidus basilensis]EHP43438.1 LysR family transcriptional regulator [Cupriavidus basilensis OR16]